ncbi:MAG: hypothetical protein U0587_21155 [Candidatus Binatia bacterium]
MKAFRVVRLPIEVANDGAFTVTFAGAAAVGPAAAVDPVVSGAIPVLGTVSGYRLFVGDAIRNATWSAVTEWCWFTRRLAASLDSLG